MTDPTCRAEYQRATCPPGARIIRCGLPVDHPGLHLEVDTDTLWPEVPDPAADAARDLKARIAELTATNDAALAEFAKQGIQVDAASIQGVRLVELLNHLLGDMDDPRRLAYELAVQERFVTVVADLRKQIEAHRSRSILLDGVNGANLPPCP
jgi:hypothetical protein